MLKFNFDYLGQISTQHGLSEDEKKVYHDRLLELLEKIKSRRQGFFEILDDSQNLLKINQYAEKVKGKYERIVVLGIGGSSLGAICLQQALTDLFGPVVGPVLNVLDNIDPVLLAEFEAKVNWERTLFIVITKSGGTPETLSQYLYFKSKVEAAGLNWCEHFTFVTDPQKGLLRRIANENPGLPVFDVPENVGGRFSVLTVVGLLPAALMGIDIEKLLEGARRIRENFFKSEAIENQAFILALTQFLLYRKGKNLTVMFPYAQKLQRLADWYRQLLAESIGKELNRAGEKVNIGITPVFSLGATDQHSQNQLYNEGPNDKFYIFMEVLTPDYDMEIPFDEKLGEELAYLKGVTFNKLLLTEMEGTIEALLKKDRPIIRISLEKLNEESMGELFLLFEASIAFLGELFEINAYDQPGVELSKILTKEMLTKK